MRKWDHYEFKIAGHYLSALINDDWSGLDDADAEQFRRWHNNQWANARDAGFKIGHWDSGPFTEGGDDGEGYNTLAESQAREADDWGICAVSGLMAMRQTVRLMVYKDEA